MGEVTSQQKQKALRKFLENKWGAFSLGYIVLMIFMATFAYVLAPDATRNANQMHLPIHSKSPGFQVTFISLPVSDPPAFSLTQWFTGSEPFVQEIPVQSYVLTDTEIRYMEYIDGIYSQGIEKHMLLAELPGSPGPELFKNKYIQEKTFWLGTDKYGRDLLSRMIIGSRVSLSIGLVAVLISIVLGLFFGMLSGYYGGKMDAAIMWLVNVIWSIPTLLLVIAVTLALGKGFWQVFIAVGLTMWVEVARVVRGQMMGLKELQFVTAAKALGFSNLRIMIIHMLPNIMAPVIVISAANFASAILIESGLSFLGLGAQPPIPSWGGMIKDHYNYIILGKPYLAIIPGLAIMFITLAFMMTGNALREVFDVKS
jgi:peptide/nickel transport system permease protein